jgi:formylglycine-generating enzyme required for sulfatase activity
MNKMIRISLCALLLALSPLLVAAETTLPDTDTILFVTIEAAGDSFSMGDGTYGPNVMQTISYKFDISKYLITNGQFALFVADGGYSEQSYWTENGWKWKGNRRQPAYWTSGSFGGPRQPVVGVSWYEAVAFCNWLSTKEGRTPAYDSSGRADLAATGYRLPTEVEWEYSAAKGAPDQAARIFPWGDDNDFQKAVSRLSRPRASKTQEVGSRSPQGDTPQGLADMCGNAWQWCSDNYQGDRDITSDTDRYYFTGDSEDQRFAMHGGSWVIDFPSGLRTRFRSFSSLPGARYNVEGFRIVRP